MSGDTWSRLAALIVAASDRVHDVAALRPEQLLIDDVGLSSLMVVNLVIDFEAAFGFVVREEDFDQLRTVGDLLRLVERKQAEALP